MARATLLAGGNLGDVAATLSLAREQIEARVGPIIERSSVRESAPWGFEAPQNFLDQVLVVETLLAPEPLLDVLEEIECELGRRKKPGHRDGGYRSRPIDLDILYYNKERVATPRLTIPHPLIRQRTFVLELLAQLSVKG